VDYFNGAPELGTGIGLDRYKAQFAFKATGTPQLDFYGLATPAWTARSVDTDGIFNATAMNCSGTCEGDDAFIGIEANVGIVWRFAPGLTLDLVGAALGAHAGHHGSRRRCGEQA
jgi:hypothetical protein